MTEELMSSGNILALDYVIAHNSREEKEDQTGIEYGYLCSYYIAVEKGVMVRYAEAPPNFSI